MSLIKTLSRKVISPGLLFLGMDRYLLSKSRHNCCIVNFHGVRKSKDGTFNNRHLDATEFERIIRYLLKRYEIISLKSAFEAHRQSKPFNKKTIALTFDDGYLNNFTVALPILKKYKVPATFYIVSKGLIQPDFYVWPDIVDLIQRHHTRTILIRNQEFAPPHFYHPGLGLNLLNFLKTLGSETEGIVKQLIEDLHLTSLIQSQNPEYLKLVEQDEFRNYAKEDLIEFGSHTHSHFNLEYLDAQSLKEELEKSKSLIEEIGGKKVVSLAFPDGSYNAQTIETALACGYTNLVAVDYRMNERNENPNLLSRFTISNSTTWESNALRLAVEYQKFSFC